MYVATVEEYYVKIQYFVYFSSYDYPLMSVGN